MKNQEAVLLASDHGGFELKEEIKRILDDQGVTWEDLGTHSSEAVDYPDFGHKLAQEVESGRRTRGILVCGTGIGMSMAANRHKGVRAALCLTGHMARMSREHNDANVLVLGGRILDKAQAREIVTTWLSTPFQGGRHARRVAKLD